MTSNPVKEEAVTPEMIEGIVARLNTLVSCGCCDDEWPRLRYDTVHLIDAMRQADPRIAELEAALRHVRPLLVLRSGIPREERGQAIERIDAALNREDKP